MIKHNDWQVSHYLSKKMTVEEHTWQEVYHDSLTGLPNRALLLELMTHVEKHEASNYAVLIFIDLVEFKNVNRNFGHDHGDNLLLQFSQRLQTNITKMGSLFRLYSDEFAILKWGSEREAVIYDASVMAEAIQAVNSEPYFLGEYGFNNTIHIGITAFETKAPRPIDFFKQADLAMYKAKISGSNSFCLYDNEMQIDAEAKFALERDLRQAIERQDLCLHYQPQLNSKKQIISAEALIRWKHPEKGWISPAEFIPLAEETGIILHLGHWVMLTACKEFQSWLNDGIELDHISVNVSAKQFHQAQFVSQVEQILDETGLPSNRLMLELTEGVVVNDIADTIDKMRLLKKIGVKLSIDDFGTGYSSLSYLNQLPLDELKIDRSFVRDINHSERGTEIVTTVIAMAINLKLSVVAEGVEEEAQFNFLLENGCQIFQGYYFSKPLMSEDFYRLAEDTLLMAL